jgi:hypothetical protein
MQVYLGFGLPGGCDRGPHFQHRHRRYGRLSDHPHGLTVRSRSLELCGIMFPSPGSADIVPTAGPQKAAANEIGDRILFSAGPYSWRTTGVSGLAPL